MANYGFLLTHEICSNLGKSTRQVWTKAKYLGLTTESVCGACGKSYPTPPGKRSHYCSQACRKAGNTARHRNHVSHNRQHTRDYTGDRRIRIWGESNPEIAARAEKFAFERLPPRLGFSNLYHASAVSPFVPFDIIATYKEQRVLIDVTT